ncbi:dihydrofolate reductase [Brevibacillus laterosporus]|uniref:dihydrofolate reductase n=1 Tax=Brevibacillus phage Sundance TaxID=1691958 RepID=UPI0006BCC4F3|nr:dihydrofolate reductase [Brevibacillus phage Sundance]ALA47912.1 putative dihydrofolate reductase [Brevibacillus phage Sundance]
MKNMIAITAMDSNNAIGKDDKLLCKLKDDLEYFRLVTEGHIVVMGSKTFESIGGLLPNRINIILTRNKNYPIPKCANCYIMHSSDDVLDFLKQQNDKKMFIIGGGQIYEEFLSYCDSLIVSHIHASFKDANVYFPKVNWNEWEPVGYPIGEEGVVPANERNEYTFSTVIYEKTVGIEIE